MYPLDRNTFQILANADGLFTLMALDGDPIPIANVAPEARAVEKPKASRRPRSTTTALASGMAGP